MGGVLEIVEGGAIPLPPRARRALASLVACPGLLPESRNLQDFDPISAAVSVSLVDDFRIQELNRDWRGKDKPTDVLSWPLWEIDEPLGEELGDVVISVDTARRQATARGWDLDDELALLLVHGVLHLLGHEDDTEAGSNVMRGLEARILGKPLDPLEPAA